MALGPAFDPNDDLTYEQAFTRIEQGADPILEARVLYAGAQTRLIKYIYPLYQVVADVQEFNYATKGAYDKARTSAIESVLSGVETTLLERIHPDMLIHSQKTGRWSTVDPPIAQLPIELRDLVCPDRDEVWVSWDWSAIEPRVLEALCGSRILRRAFDEGIDLHTWTVCVIFNYEFPVNLIDPHKSPECVEWRKKYDWRGKDDPRRVFAKTGRYEMYYGGTGGNAADAAALFGLDPKVLRKALGSLLTADPEYYSWRLHLESALKNTRVVRTFMGRPRRFLKGGQKMIREGLDQPMQGAVSDIFNTTVILGSQIHPRVQFAWGMHDSQKWHCPIGMAEEMKGVLKRIAERPFTINNKQVVFPADIELIYPPERSVSYENVH
jgi:DNA polymerase-1